MSLLYSTNFKFSNDEMKKFPDFMDCDANTNNPPQEHNNSGGLMRNCSAPTSLFASLVDGVDGLENGGGGGGGGRDDYRFVRSSSPEVEVILSRFMASCNGAMDSGERAVKQEAVESVHQQNGSCCSSSSMVDSAAGAQIGSSFGVMNSSDFGNSMGLQLGARNCSNLYRQNSSPAGFFSHFGTENGCHTTRDVEKFGSCNRKDVAAAYPASARISNQLNLSGQSFGPSHMPPIAEEENKSMDVVSSSRHRLQKANGLHANDFLNSSWDESTFRDFKRGRDNNGRTFSTSIALKTQNADSGNSIRGLTHHLSLPINFADKTPVENFLTFQDPVPHQIRAKRGCATHPRSIAERMRRSRISDRMKKLQELFPDMDKQTSTADMLELAVEYIKGLQRQVKTLMDTKARCTCSCSSK